MKKCYETIQNPDFLRFAHECNKRREYLGWSQDDVALRAGVCRASISLIESGKRIGSADTAFRVCKVLGINPIAILWDSGKVTSNGAIYEST